MDVKRLFRGPLFWVLMFLLAAIVLTRLLDTTGGFEPVDTGRVVTEIDDGNAKSAKIIGGEAQEIQLTLKNDDRISAQYVEGQGLELVNQLQEQEDSGSLTEGYDVEVPQASVLWSLLGARSFSLRR
jgi:cell division protease FtsH